MIRALPITKSINCRTDRRKELSAAPELIGSADFRSVSGGARRTMEQTNVEPYTCF